MDKEYVVTLYKREDLEQFYNEMMLTNFPLVKKRPISRNTHYMMTEAQAEQLRQDPRIWGVECVDDINVVRPRVVNNEPTPIGGTFWKQDNSSSVSSSWRQWGHVHCAGDAAQRRKNAWGGGSGLNTVTDTVEIHNNGRHVDVVIVDDEVSWDAEEWYSPTTNSSRFVQYQWFNELNSLVNSIDDDNQTEPTGTIVYDTTATCPESHGIHVTGTATGQHYGWASEAWIYNIAVTSTFSSGQSMPPLLIFDYLRAFHRAKPVNQETGYKNPTVTNHSYGGVRYMNNEENLVFSDLTSVTYRGVTYNSGNPGPSGWTQSGVETDFGVRFNLNAYPSYSSAMAADVQDAIADGIIVIGAAGNDNLLMDVPGGPDWDNVMSVSGPGSFYYNRGAWPCTPDAGSINVGALSDQQDFRRSTYTMFGPGVDIFAPGDQILSSYNNSGLNDSKYSQGTGNYFYPIQGTSMASPQVCGVIACVAGLNPRFTQEDARGFLDRTSIYSDMSFDLGSSDFNDNTCSLGSPNKYLHIENPRGTGGSIANWSELCSSRIASKQVFPRKRVLHGKQPSQVLTTYTYTVTSSGSSHYVFAGDLTGNDPTIACNVGDTLVFNVNASGHPFYLKSALVTGTGSQVSTGTVSGNGTSVGTVTWDTAGVTPGTYYYICQFHSAMAGQIIIS